jgi:signal peptidase I
MDNKSVFLSVENMKLCQNVLGKYILDQYDFDVRSDGSKTNIKKLLYDVMQDVQLQYGNTPDITLKDMNNITLNITRDYYTTNYKLTKQNKKTTVQTLERDHNVYGPRVLNYEQIKPVSQTRTENVNRAFETVENLRRSEQQNSLPFPDEIKPVMESAYEPDEFMRRVSELEKKRDDIEIKDLTAVQGNRLQQDSQIAAQSSHNPKQMYQITTEQNQHAERQRKSLEDTNRSVSRMESIAPPISQQILLDKFLSINGFDRNWTVDKNRFDFKVDFSFGENSIQNRYRNIKSIKAARVIIPMEISEERTIVNTPKTFYNHEFGLSYPYLMLYVDEFGDVYDGTNDSARRCFCQLVFDKCYKSPNGRGYIILNTIQGEQKIFHPTPLSSLSRLTLSIRRPNGELLNMSKDDYNIFKIEYDLYNKQYLKIVTHKYFDRNEFYKGDTVLMKDYKIENVDPNMSDEAIWKFNAFMNRKEGHEIIEMGQPNENGFFRNFFIYGPGEFDTKCGIYTLDSEQIANLNTYNDSINFGTWTGTNGSLLNTSLQFSIAFKLQVVATDPGIIDTTFHQSITTL